MLSNKKNLVQNKNLTPSERRKNASKAGKASGKARRKKADLRKAMTQLLQMEVTNETYKEELEKLGLEGDNQSLLVLQMFQRALKGNQRAVENIIKLTVNKKDEHDIAEQKAKIKLINKQVEEGSGQDDFQQIIINDPWRKKHE